MNPKDAVERIQRLIETWSKECGGSIGVACIMYTMTGEPIACQDTPTVPTSYFEVMCFWWNPQSRCTYDRNNAITSTLRCNSGRQGEHP